MKKVLQIILVILFILALVLGVTRWDTSAPTTQTGQQP
jgi:hypothetical protein